MSLYQLSVSFIVSRNHYEFCKNFVRLNYSQLNRVVNIVREIIRPSLDYLHGPPSRIDNGIVEIKLGYREFCQGWK